MKFLKKLVFLITLTWFSASSASDIPLIIVSPDANVSHLSSRKLLRIYSMQQKRWPNGKKINVYILPQLEHPHQTFVKSVLNSQPYQLERHWKRLLYSGIGKKPIQLDSVAAMISTVKSTSGAIGYIPANKTVDPSLVLEVK
jgi:ABC-type phosphate transport system substrate-binding protein